MTNDKDKNEQGPVQIGDLLPKLVSSAKYKKPTPLQERLLSMPELEPQDVTILYQHSVLCQTSMPYRDPGEEVRLWQRRNGIVRLELQAGRVLDPTTDDFVNVGLPFGPKPRLVLFHLNAEAMRKQSPVIELEDSLTAFVRRTLGLDTKGRNIRAVKDQLSRLAAADFRIGATHDGRAVTVKGTVIEGLELWSPKDASQRVLWPTVIQFSDKYFQSLMQHAVPLNEAAVARLSHSAMALDVYTWLANRLHRVPLSGPAFVPWTSLKEQFGHGYDRMVDFRRVFTRTLTQVRVVYKDAKYALDPKGARLYNSRPPIQGRVVRVK